MGLFDAQRFALQIFQILAAYSGGKVALEPRKAQGDFMLSQIKRFFVKNFLKGILVILPAALIIFILLWLYELISRFVQPVTEFLLSKISVGESFAEIISITITLLSLVLIGWLASTGPGLGAIRALERAILRRAPGYKILKEIATRFASSKKQPFSRAALVRLTEQGHYATGFITDEHKNGIFTVFVPESPIPTSGQIYHLSAEWVQPLDAPVEEVMQSIFGCGVGSKKLLAAHLKGTESNRPS